MGSVNRLPGSLYSVTCIVAASACIYTDLQYAIPEVKVNGWNLD